MRSGLVLVSGAPATKVATLVGDDQPLILRGQPRRYVSRGGDKLRAALDRFSVDPAGCECLDAGASTGGFTDCLLQAGAARVIAFDVGYGQLAWALRTDDRVIVVERQNARELEPGSLAFDPAIVVADLSFISLRAVVAALAGVARTDATFLVLVKPQFEAGPRHVGKGGVVREPAVWRTVLDDVASAFSRQGLGPAGIMASPVLGPAGNVEFVLHARKGSAASTLNLDAAVAEALEVRG